MSIIIAITIAGIIGLVGLFALWLGILWLAMNINRYRGN